METLNFYPEIKDQAYQLLEDIKDIANLDSIVIIDELVKQLNAAKAEILKQ